MSYNSPTPHEIRISERLQRVAKRLQKMLLKETEGNCDFVLVVSSKRRPVPEKKIRDQPIGSYVSSSNRETSALMLAELLYKWQANEDIPPIHQLTDAEGRTLAEILGKGPH